MPMWATHWVPLLHIYFTHPNRSTESLIICMYANNIWTLKAKMCLRGYADNECPHQPYIAKTYLYNFDPLKPHFYIVKLGFTGVYIIFLISAQNIDCGYSLEPPRRGGSNEYLQSVIWAETWKISEFFYLKMFSFWRWNFLFIWIGVFS